MSRKRTATWNYVTSHRFWVYETTCNVHRLSAMYLSFSRLAQSSRNQRVFKRPSAFPLPLRLGAPRLPSPPDLISLNFESYPLSSSFLLRLLPAQFTLFLYSSCFLFSRFPPEWEFVQRYSSRKIYSYNSTYRLHPTPRSNLSRVFRPSSEGRVKGDTQCGLGH